jgi:hypothetical protein
MWARTKYNTAAVLSSLFVLGTLWQPVSAQKHQNFEGKTILLPVGMTLEGRIDTTISSNHSKQGQRFKIIMASPVLANGSEVVIPAGSYVMGEVVEAISAGSQKRRVGYSKPQGHLHTQLNELKTPDGAVYPIAAELAPEVFFHGGKTYKNATNLGGGMGWVGDINSFNAAAPLVPRQGRNKVGTRREMEQDMNRNSIYGRDIQGTTNTGTGYVRSVQVHNRDIYIAGGSPVSIKLNAPFKITLTGGVSSTDAAFASAQERATRTGDRRFATEAEPNAQQGQASPTGGLPFLQGPTATMQPAAPGAPAVPPLQQPQQAAPPAQSGSDF